MQSVALSESAGALGPYPAQCFVTTLGGEAAFPARQAGWYFEREWVAVPRPGLQVAGFGRGAAPFRELGEWAAQWVPAAEGDLPPLVWLAAPHTVRRARLDPMGETLTVGGRTLPFALVPKIALNRAYWNEASRDWFAVRHIRLRGTHAEGRFVARTLWPEDFRLGPVPPPLRTLPGADSATSMRTLMREQPQGGARAPFAATALWQRKADTSWAGRPVIGLVVNGARGDDDEAHGGHFAIVTGRVQADGQIGDWLVNNFYSLDVESEKGILAAPVPLDNYLADLNAGQGWYRPSAMLVAVLDDERAALLVQAALNRVFNQFWRHQLVYYHPNMNCTSISIDTLRALGWPVPARGPASRLLAWLGFPWFVLKERSIDKARLAFDYLRTDQTRLLPAAALEEAFASLLQIGRVPPAAGKLAQWLRQDLAAIAWLRFPQFPSSRAFGDAPAVTTWEVRARVPADPALAQVVPVPPRPFPPELRDPDLLAPRWTAADSVTLLWAALSVVGLPLLLWRWWRRRR